MGKFIRDLKREMKATGLDVKGIDARLRAFDRIMEEIARVELTEGQVDDEGVKSDVAEIDAKMNRAGVKLAVFGKLLIPKAEAVAVEIAKEGADKLGNEFKKKRLANFHDKLQEILIKLEEQLEEIKQEHFVKEEDKKDIIKILESISNSYFKSMREVIDYKEKYKPLFKRLKQQSEEKKIPQAYKEMENAYELLVKAMQGTLNALEKPKRWSKVKGAIDILEVDIGEDDEDYRLSIEKQFVAAHLKVKEAIKNFELWGLYQTDFRQKVEALYEKLSERGAERAKEIYKAQQEAPQIPPPAA